MENRLDHIIEIFCPQCRCPQQRSVRWFFSNRSCPRCNGDIGEAIEKVLLDLRDAYRHFEDSKPK